MLDPHRLRVFRSVMASGSVQGAADNLRMTSSAVSQHLQALARETGLVLFEKAGRRIVPTAAARALDEATDNLMSQMSRVDQVVADLREGRSGRLVIGYFSSAGMRWMPELAHELLTEMPDLTLELILNDTGAPAALPDIDLTIEGPEIPVRPGYRRIDLVGDDFVAVLPGDHRLAGSAQVALRDLRAERWVSNDLPSSIGHKLVVAACAASGFTPRFAVQAQDFMSAIAFVGAGVGITVVPGMAAQNAPTSVAVLPIEEPRPMRHLSVLLREVGSPNAAAELAVDLLLDLAGHTPIRAF